MSKINIIRTVLGVLCIGWIVYCMAHNVEDIRIVVAPAIVYMLLSGLLSTISRELREIKKEE